MRSGLAGRRALIQRAGRAAGLPAKAAGIEPAAARVRYRSRRGARRRVPRPAGSARQGAGPATFRDFSAVAQLIFDS